MLPPIMARVSRNTELALRVTPKKSILRSMVKSRESLTMRKVMSMENSTIPRLKKNMARQVKALVKAPLTTGPIARPRAPMPPPDSYGQAQVFTQEGHRQNGERAGHHHGAAHSLDNPGGLQHIYVGGQG